jgi:uncharacterized protein YjbI with pentapeptide repeats
MVGREGDDMANPEHLAILKKGVEAWNEWRKQDLVKRATYYTENSLDLKGIRQFATHFVGALLDDVDLSDSVLAHVDLSGGSFSDSLLIKADLRDANLSHTDLHRAVLTGANLEDARLVGADLHSACLEGVILKDADLTDANLLHVSLVKADLQRANLGHTDLREAVLTGANLEDARLVGADLHGAHLDGVILEHADLTDANLQGVSLEAANLTRVCLSQADLCGSDLSNADCRGADFTGAKLVGTSLSHANLHTTRLHNADLTQADMRYCKLTRSDLSGVTLTGARLYGTARDDWIIECVECKYVFWDAKGEIRSPKDRDLAPGEFEQLYRMLPTIEYIFRNGMTPLDLLIMDRVVQAIREQIPEYDIKIDSISARGLAPSIKLTVQQVEHKGPALAEVTRVYEAKVQELAGRLDEAKGFIQLLIDRPNSVQITNATGQYIALPGSTINIDQHVEYITNLRDAVAALPEDSPTFAKVAKKTALDIIGGALKDVARGQVKEAAKQICELGKDLGPLIVNTAAYGFLKSCTGL